MKNRKTREWRERQDLYDFSVLHENPCKPDCPNRNAECHAKCEAYAKYAEGRREISRQKCLVNSLNRR